MIGLYAPAFWWRQPQDAGRMSSMLSPVARLYGRIVERRLGERGSDIGVPVVCIGNLTVGGTGKTPAAIAVARMLRAVGERVFLLTRGYGGRLAGPLIVDPMQHSARDVGDEALLLARAAPTVVARDRFKGGTLARDKGASVIVMDDGFQNPALVKHLSVLMLDGRRGLGNGRVFPAGPLRASLADQLERAQAMIVVGDIGGIGPVIASAKSSGLTVFYGRLEPDAGAVAALADKKVLAFAGIGDPEKFLATLREAAVDVAGLRQFADHHRYRKGEAVALVAEAERESLTLVTTEKDMVRIRSDPRLAILATRARPLPVTLSLYRPDELATFLMTELAPHRRGKDARGQEPTP
jgi:tetraacyldisaccharide 4'-kinase